MKRILSMILTALYIVSGTVVFASCSPAGSSGAGMMYVTIDINPSFELLVDDKGTVVSCVALNEDADTVLEGSGSLTGQTAADAVETIVSGAADEGFLTKSNPVVESTIVSAEGDVTAEEDLSEEIEGAVRSVAERGHGFVKYLRMSQADLAIELQELKDSEEYKNNEAVQSLSLGQYRLIREVMESCDITFDEALAKTTRELVGMLKEVRIEQQKMAFYVRKRINEERKAFKNKANAEGRENLVDKYLESHPDDTAALAYKAVAEALGKLESVTPDLKKVAEVALTDDEITAVAGVLGMSADELKAKFDSNTAITFKKIYEVVNRLFTDDDDDDKDDETTAAVTAADSTAAETTVLKTTVAETTGTNAQTGLDRDSIICGLKEIFISVRERYMNEQLAGIDFTAVTAALANITLPEGITLPELGGAVTYENFCNLRSALYDAESELFNQIRENNNKTGDAKKNGKGEHGKSKNNNEDNEGLNENDKKKMKDYLESVRNEADREWKGRKNGGN